MELIQIKDRVKVALKENPELRDIDEKLIAHIWESDLAAMELDPSKTPTSQVLTLYRNKKLTNTESIRRSRQQLQRLYPELLGKTTQEKKEEQQEDVKQQLRQF